MDEIENNIEKDLYDVDFEGEYFFITFLTEKILLKKIEDDDSLSVIDEFDDIDHLHAAKYKNKNEIQKVVNQPQSFFTQEVSFDSDEYIRNIYNSYKMNWDNIYAQYKKDFTRQDLLIDKTLVYNPVIFEDFVSKFREYIFCVDLELFYDKLFIMLAIQSSYYFMYLYSKSFENKFRKIYDNPDLYIVNGPNKTIHFETIRENEISFKAFLTLFVKDVNDDKKVFNVIYLELNIIFKLTCNNNNNNSIYTALIDLLFNNKKKNNTNYGTLVIKIV